MLSVAYYAENYAGIIDASLSLILKPQRLLWPSESPVQSHPKGLKLLLDSESTAFESALGLNLMFIHFIWIP